MNVFSVYHLPGINNANNATHSVQLGKKRRESSKRDYYIISSTVTMKAIVILGTIIYTENM